MRKAWIALTLLLALLCRVSASAQSDHTYFYTAPFTLDTRSPGGSLTEVFTLDTRDINPGTLTELFTLDTRAELLPYTSVFTLDTRDSDTLQVPQEVTLRPEELTVMRVSWSYQGTPEGFVVERRAPLGEWHAVELGGGERRHWFDRTIRPAAFYEYRVAAMLGPHLWSDYSDIAYIQAPSMPAPPTDLTVVWSEDLSAAILEWQDQSHNETGFDLWRKTGLTGTWASHATIPSNTTTFIDSETAPSTLYTYKIRAFNAWGASAFSPEVTLTTPGAGTGCGWELIVEDAAVDFDGRSLDLAAVNTVHAGAAGGGGLVATLRSPPGNPHPTRVVLGFRDQQGRAAAQPVEIMEFYRHPGCPGQTYTARIPEDFRAPEEGEYTLWLEMVMANRDPVRAFLTERHTQESPMRKRVVEVDAVESDAALMSLWVADVQGIPQTDVSMPLYLSSPAGVQATEFSLAIAEGLSLEGIEAGPDAQAAMVDWSVDEGVAVRMEMPLVQPLPGGTKHVLTLWVTMEEEGLYEVAFADEPVARTIVGAGLSVADLSWRTGMLTAAASTLAGDIYPRPYGDGVVDDADADLALLFVLGVIDLPKRDSEFRRLDVAPLADCGDGVVDMADYQVIQLLASGVLDKRQVCDAPAELDPGILPFAMGELVGHARTLSLGLPGTANRGEPFSVDIQLDAVGDEHGLSVTLAYDPDVISPKDLTLAPGLAGARYLSNFEELAEGVVSFGLILQDGESFVEGFSTLATLEFRALAGSGDTSTAIEFVHKPAPTSITGIDGAPLPILLMDATLGIRDDRVTANAPIAPAWAEAEAVSEGEIRLSWSPAQWATGYVIRRRIAGEADWSLLTELDLHRTAYLDKGLPPDTWVDYLLAAVNPNGEESEAIRLREKTWSALEAWRFHWFGQIENEGIAADAADPDGDGIPNRLEYELGLNPLEPLDSWMSTRQEEVFGGRSSVTLRHRVAKDAPLNFSFEVSNDLLDPDSWRMLELPAVSQDELDSGIEIRRVLPMPTATNRAIYIRMRAD